MNTRLPGRSGSGRRFTSISSHRSRKARSDRAVQWSVFMWYGSSAMYGSAWSPKRTGRLGGSTFHDSMSPKLRARRRSTVASPVDSVAFSGRCELSGIWVNSASNNASTSSPAQSMSDTVHTLVATSSGFFRHIRAT